MTDVNSMGFEEETVRMLLIAYKCNPTPNCLHIKKINSHPTGNSEMYRFLSGA